MRIAFISRNSGYRPLAERLAAKLPAHEVVFRGTSGPLDLEGDKRALKQGSAWAQPQGTALLRGAGEDRGAGGGAARGTARGGGAGRLLAGAGGSPASDPSAPRGFMLRPSVALLLLLLFLVGCGSATRGFRPTTNQHTFHYSGMYGTAPAQGASNGGLSQGIPRAALRFVPQGAMTAAEAGPATTAGNALVAGGAVVVAGSSVVLVCLTVKAALNGMQTPIDIADTFYGTHFGDLQGWFQGCYAPKATVAPGESTPTFDVKPESEPHALPTPRRSPEAHEGGDKKSWGRIYATYTKYNPQTGRYYSGRTSMVVDLSKPLRPQAVAAINARDSNHHIDENDELEVSGFRPALLDQFDVGTSIGYENRYSDVAYWRIRGREQQLIDSLGGAQSDTHPPYRTENVQRGVAKDNPLGRLFHDAATKQWGQLHPYTGT